MVGVSKSVCRCRKRSEEVGGAVECLAGKSFRLFSDRCGGGVRCEECLRERC